MKNIRKNKSIKSIRKVLLFLCLVLVLATATNVGAAMYGAGLQQEDVVWSGETTEEKVNSKKHSFQSGNNQVSLNSSEIIAIYICRVKPGMLKQNKKIWDYFVKRISENERGWKGNCYYNSDESIVTYIEIFENIEAFEFHEEEHLRDLEARKKWEATAEVISAGLYGSISTESSELLKQKSISKKYSGNLKFCSTFQDSDNLLNKNQHNELNIKNKLK